ncbi:MAG: BON domain-containing protein [Tepidisphaeraceae bacterium]|jgi:osmotically-inducible protein OsmY
MKSDSELQNDVEAQLLWQPEVNAAHIGVAAKNGVVTLTGQVEHYAQKAAAEDAAKSVYGVKGVANDIEVQLPGSSKRTDADVASAALSALKWDYEVPDDKVTVTVRDGWVTLEGTVDWQYQKDAAERCIQYLMGVKGVTNSIIIKTKPTPEGVKVKIEDAFKRNADLDARRITVNTYNGKVTLSGSVSSWSERDEAETGARAAPGVSSVDDQLVVMP